MDSRSDKKSILLCPVSNGKDFRLSNNNIYQTEEIEKDISSSPKSTNNKVLRVFHQNIR
jgi:hypothetical protein